MSLNDIGRCENCGCNLPQPRQTVAEIKLPLNGPYDTSLMLVLYRWRDRHYENTEIKNSNDSGAVVAIVEIMNEIIKESTK